MRIEINEQRFTGTVDARFSINAAGRRTVEFGSGRLNDPANVVRINGVEYVVGSFRFVETDRAWSHDRNWGIAKVTGYTTDYKGEPSAEWSGRNDITDSAWDKLREWGKITATRLAEAHQDEFMPTFREGWLQPTMHRNHARSLKIRARLAELIAEFHEFLADVEFELEPLADRPTPIVLNPDDITGSRVTLTASITVGGALVGYVIAWPTGSGSGMIPETFIVSEAPCKLGERFTRSLDDVYSTFGDID